MLTCTNCGASVREGARFCTSCGTRLNDPVSPEATGVWASPVASDHASSGATTSVADPVSNDGDLSAMDAGTGPGTGSSGDPAARSNTSAEPVSSTDEGFSWSWGTSARTDGDDRNTTRQVDEESGIVLEEDRPGDTAAADAEIVDATEIDIRKPDDPGPDVDRADAPAPETGDTMLVIDEEITSEQGESETLAAWAGQWDAQDTEGEMTATDSPSDMAAEEPDAPTGPQTSASTTEDPGDGDDEDTVAKAERLIGELRSIIPTLARPMPAPASDVPDPTPLADELEGAARAKQFDDLRETLQAARERPRDVDTMLDLSSKVDRLLDLLDDRDNLAKTAESAATRLRPAAGATEM